MEGRWEVRPWLITDCRFMCSVGVNDGSCCKICEDLRAHVKPRGILLKIRDQRLRESPWPFVFCVEVEYRGGEVVVLMVGLGSLLRRFSSKVAPVLGVMSRHSLPYVEGADCLPGLILAPSLYSTPSRQNLAVPQEEESPRF